MYLLVDYENVNHNNSVENELALIPAKDKKSEEFIQKILWSEIRIGGYEMGLTPYQAIDDEGNEFSVYAFTGDVVKVVETSRFLLNDIELIDRNNLSEVIYSVIAKGYKSLENIQNNYRLINRTVVLLSLNPFTIFVFNILSSRNILHITIWALFMIAVS